MSVSVVIVGLGDVAERIHLPACRDVPDITVVAGCDPDPGRRAAMKARFRIPRVYEQAEALFERERPDLVLIGSPPDTHEALCLQALRAGADVLCEKPFVMTVDQADTVVAEAKTLGRVLAVNTQYRFMPIYRAAQGAIGTPEAGSLDFLQCWQQMHLPPREDAKPWRARLLRSTLFEFAPHVVDLLMFFFDARPSTIRAELPGHGRGDRSDDLVHLTLRFPESRLATVALNRRSHAAERYLEMRLDCERASMRISLGGVAHAGIRLATWRGRRRIVPEVSFARGGEARIESGDGSRLLARAPRPAFARATARHLEDLLARRGTNGEARWLPAEHARFLTHVIESGYRSAAHDETITL